MATLQLRPDGGDGGNGGDVYFKGAAHLYGFRSYIEGEKYRAQNGEDGKKGDKHGSKGEDLILQVPLTTEITTEEGKKIIISEEGQLVKALSGGKGTLGSVTMKKYKIKPEKVMTDTDGRTARITLTLKIKSDIIFIGYPNAGKSSLLTAITNADAKAGAYAFTTLEPQLGRMNGLRLLDLPGLIDHAHKGKGLGTGFVKHTEYSRLIAHFVSYDNDDPVEAYESMREELANISEKLSTMPEVVLLTKYDEATQEKRESVKKYFNKHNVPFHECSILDDDSLTAVKEFLTKHMPKDESATS